MIVLWNQVGAEFVALRFLIDLSRVYFNYVSFFIQIIFDENDAQSAPQIGLSIVAIVLHLLFI